MQRPQDSVSYDKINKLNLARKAVGFFFFVVKIYIEPFVFSSD